MHSVFMCSFKSLGITAPDLKIDFHAVILSVLFYFSFFSFIFSLIFIFLMGGILITNF